VRLLLVVKDTNKIHVWQLQDGKDALYFKGSDDVFRVLAVTLDGGFQKVIGREVYVGWVHDNASILLWGAKGGEKIIDNTIFIPSYQYAKKYNIKKKTIRKLIGKEEFAPQLHIRDKRGRVWVLFEDKPPPADLLLSLRRRVRERKDTTDWVKWMNERLSKFTGVRLVRIRAQPQHKHKMYYWARHSVLFRGGRFYYYLYNPLGKSLEEIKETYPNPVDIMFPRPQMGKEKRIRWEDIIPVSEANLRRTYYVRHRPQASDGKTIVEKGGGGGTQ